MNRSYITIFGAGKSSLGRIVLFAASLFLFAACGGSKRLAQPKEPAVIAKQELKAEDFLNNKVHYRTFSGKAQAHLVTKDQDQNFTLNLRMKKDEQIWSSVIALGVAEVARAMLTPDSLRAIVRIGKKAYAMSYEEGQQLIKADVDFPVLQNLLIGNVLVEDMSVSKLEETDSLVVITMQKEAYKQVLTYDKKQQLLQQLSLTAADRDFSCTISYGKYGPTTHSQPFSYQRYIIIKNKKDELKLNLDFTRAELDGPADFAFDIPSSYTLQQIKGKVK